MYGPSESEWRFFVAMAVFGMVASLLFLASVGWWLGRGASRLFFATPPAAASCACDECRCCDACPAQEER